MPELLFEVESLETNIITWYCTVHLFIFNFFFVSLPSLQHFPPPPLNFSRLFQVGFPCVSPPSFGGTPFTPSFLSFSSVFCLLYSITLLCLKYMTCFGNQSSQIFHVLARIIRYLKILTTHHPPTYSHSPLPRQLFEIFFFKKKKIYMDDIRFLGGRDEERKKEKQDKEKRRKKTYPTPRTLLFKKCRLLPALPLRCLCIFDAINYRIAL